MELIENGFYVNLLLMVVVLLVSFVVGAKVGLRPLACLLLYMWHTVFVFIYAFDSLKGASDSLYYFERAVRGDFEIAAGTEFIVAIVYFIRMLVEIDFMGAMIIFGGIGLIGYILFFGAVLKTFVYLSRRQKILMVLVMLLPSISYWSVAIGKDSLFFFAISLILYSEANRHGRVILQFAAILLIGLVRPHMAGFILLSYILYFISSRRVNLVSKLISIVVILPAMAFVLSTALQGAGLSDASYSDILDDVDNRATANREGGGAIDTESWSYGEKIFGYFFRPLFFDVSNFPGLIASIENVMLLLLFVYFLYHLREYGRLRVNIFELAGRKYLYIYCLVCVFFLPIGLSNLGIALRQKWMVMPVMIFCAIEFISLYNSQVRQRKRSANLDADDIRF